LKNIQYFLVITAAYILCHGLTALVVTPIQELFLTDVTVFASLVYLPHGVRVLATWLWGWRAFFPLSLGACLAQVIFTPVDTQDVIRESVLSSVTVGALSALLAFEIMRLLGRNLYADENREMNWKHLVFVGAVASVINSAGQTYVFSGVILPDHAMPVFATYAVGDLIGLFVSMLALMMTFRWIRLFTESN
jgi:hypothetical protein